MAGDFKKSDFNSTDVPVECEVTRWAKHIFSLFKINFYSWGNTIPIPKTIKFGHYEKCQKNYSIWAKILHEYTSLGACIYSIQYTCISGVILRASLCEKHCTVSYLQLTGPACVLRMLSCHESGCWSSPAHSFSWKRDTLKTCYKKTWLRNIVDQNQISDSESEIILAFLP